MVTAPKCKIKFVTFLAQATLYRVEPVIRIAMTMVRTATITTAANAMTDEEVVRPVRAGNTRLFEVIMRRYNQRLYRVTRSILGNDGIREDRVASGRGF